MSPLVFTVIFRFCRLAWQGCALGDLQFKSIINPESEYILMHLDDNPNCLSPFASNDLKLKTMISNNLSYKGFAERSCGNFMKRLAISAVPKGDGDDEKTKEEVLDLSALHRQFPKLTHLKILNYKRVHDAGKIEGFPYLISLVVKGLRKEDTEGLQAWCQRRRITFLSVDP